MTGGGRLREWVSRALHPRSIRTRIALVIVAAMGVSVAGILWVVGATIEASTQAEMERTLERQAAVVARTIDDAGQRTAARSAREAQRFMGDVRMVVRVSGEVVYYSSPTLDDVEVRAQATSGDVEVRLERPDPQARAVDRWVYFAVVALCIAFVAGVVWYLSSLLGRHMSRSVGEVADSAEAVARGRLDVRVAEGEDELGRLGHAFNRMAGRLEAADQRQREFLADVAHELRTPVTAIEGFASALADGTARTEDDRTEAAETIRDEARRLRDLVSDLQTLTWLDLDPPAAAEPIDLVAAAAATAARFGPEARSRGVTIVPPRGERWAVGDPTHVDTILSNLLRNALAATPAGGTITIAPAVAPGRVGIALSDTGRGIAPKHLPYVFDRLYRADPSRSRGPDGAHGSGLGLSIVRRLATLQGGTMGVESVVGRGSTFTLWLPPAPSRRSGPSRRAGGRRGEGRGPDPTIPPTGSDPAV